MSHGSLTISYTRKYSRCLRRYKSGSLTPFFSQIISYHPFMSSVSILSLPLHVLQSILCRLENADSLMAAVCSHSLFYAAFKEHQESIAEVVSSREVSSTLYPFALAAFSIQSKPFDVDFLTNVLYDLQYRVLNFPSRGSINFKCQSSLRSASYISKLHKSVCYFTHHLGGEAMDRALIDLYLTRDLRELPSDAEAFLIQRAFYRFQILCEIVTACSKARGADDSLPQGVFTKVFVADILLGPFPPWVNEQLACAYDLLEEALFQSTLKVIKIVQLVANARMSEFCRVAKQDIEWGARHVSYASTPDDRPYIRGLVRELLSTLMPLPQTTLTSFLVDLWAAALASSPHRYAIRRDPRSSGFQALGLQ